jgi:VWFA-related protein
VVRVSVEVIQVDAVVTDKADRHVPDLGPGDFEVFEDGRRQDITQCSYVAVSGPSATSAAPPGRSERARSPQPDPREPVRRTMAVVVDDLNLGFVSLVTARRALAHFVDEQMQPGDLVAIVPTGGGSGAFQQFTSDKRVLKAAIARLHFSLAGRGAVKGLSLEGTGLNENGPATWPEALGAEMNAFADVSNRQRQVDLALGTMGALQSALRGLRGVPGRKSLVFLSEGFVQRDRTGDRSAIYEQMRAVTDLANRSSVVIYAINPAGLETRRPAADAPNGSPDSSLPPNSTLAVSGLAAEELRGGPLTFTDETGGLLLEDTNDISGALRRVLEDQSGYYLIGYKPDEAYFEPDKAGPKYHKIEVKVKRPGLRVRSRKGFFAVASAGAESPSSAGHEGLADVIDSPVSAWMGGVARSSFAARDLEVRLTSLFGSDARSGSYVRSLLYIDLEGVTFQEQPDGTSQAKLEVGVMTFGIDGFAVERRARSVTIPEFFEGTRREGVTFTLDVPVKKPGPYQVRAAVRDLASARLGSASQFLEVPNLGENRLALSGLVLSGGATADGNGVRPVTDVGDRDPTPAVRRFRRGSSVSYAVSVFNAHTRSAKGRPDLLVRPSLYRDDRLLQAMPTLSLDGAGQPDPKHLAVAGSFRIDATMEPGLYALEVAVQDRAAGPKAGPVAQWMDFEVVD